MLKNDTKYQTNTYYVIENGEYVKATGAYDPTNTYYELSSTTNSTYYTVSVANELTAEDYEIGKYAIFENNKYIISVDPFDENETYYSIYQATVTDESLFENKNVVVQSGFFKLALDEYSEFATYYSLTDVLATVVDAKENQFEENTYYSLNQDGFTYTVSNTYNINNVYFTLSAMKIDVNTTVFETNKYYILSNGDYVLATEYDTNETYYLPVYTELDKTTEAFKEDTYYILNDGVYELVTSFDEDLDSNKTFYKLNTTLYRLLQG